MFLPLLEGRPKEEKHHDQNRGQGDLSEELH
jgi:hypothetical protein